MAGLANAQDLFPADTSPWADPHGTLASVLGAGQISSGYRSPAKNAAVGGSPTSSHPDGQAVDWIPADGNTRAAAIKLAQAGIPYDQIIDEGTHLHVGYGPKMRGQVLTSQPVGDAASMFPAPPPAAASLFPASPPPVPKLKPNTVPVPPSLMDSVVGAVKSAGANLEANISARSKAALAGAKAGLAEINAPYDPNEDAYMPALRQAHGAVSAIGGAFSAAVAPISGYAQSTAGQTLEKATKGAVPKEVIGDYTDAMLGFVAPESLLTPKARAMRARAAAKEVPEAAPETPAPAAPEVAPAAEDLFPATPEPAAPEAAPAASESAAAPETPVTESAAAPAAEDLFPAESNVVPFEPKARTMAATAESADPELVGSAHVGDGGPVVGNEADPVERVDNALYRLSGHKEADKVDTQQFLKAMPAEIKDPAVQEELYHAIEQKMVDPNYVIPEHLQPAWEAMQGPYQEQTDLINHLRELGDPEAEHYGYDTGYVARRAEGHTPLFDDTEGPGRGDPILGTKPNLTNKAQAQKQRTAGFMATDQDGNTVFTDTPDRTDIMDRPYASVRPATTAEIEANTGTTYHKNALVNTLDNVMHLRQVVRNHEVLDELKQNLIDQGLAHRDEHYFRGEDGMMNTVQANTERPEGFRQVPSVPQLKGMSFAPHIAEVLEDNFNRPLPGDPLEALSKVNRALTVPMFITPIIHAQNVAVHWGIGRGFDWVRPGGVKSLLNDGASAIHQVLTMGPIYKELIRDGMAGQFIGTQTRDFHAQLLKAAGKEIDPEMQSIFAKAAGVPWKAIKAVYNTSSKALWYVNDVMLMQRVLELKRKGMSTHEAIFEAEREIPNYRIPPRVGGTGAGVAGRTASRVLQSSAIGMFNRYKYGAARAWAALAKDLAKGTPKQRAEAVGKLLVAIVTATGLYPAMDWAAQKATGNKNARFKRAGGLAMTDAAYNVATGKKDPSLASSTFFSPGPVEQLGTGLVGNHDFFGREIRTPGAPPWFQSAEAAKYLGTQGFYPGRLADQALSGQGDQALGQLAGLQLPTDKQVQNKKKYEGLDKSHAAVAVGRFKNRVKSGNVADAVNKMGR